MMTVAALGNSSIFAVYTFIGPFVTALVLLRREAIPLALALFGIGMTVGNLYGGRLADAHPKRGIVAGYGCALVVLVVLSLWGANTWILFPALFGVGATMMAAILTIQVRLTSLAPESRTLMGAMNLASLNVANALGAWAGGLTIGVGLAYYRPSGPALPQAGLGPHQSAPVGGFSHKRRQRKSRLDQNGHWRRSARPVAKMPLPGETRERGSQFSWSRAQLVGTWREQETRSVGARCFSPRPFETKRSNIHRSGVTLTAIAKKFAISPTRVRTIFGNLER